MAQVTITLNEKQEDIIAYYRYKYKSKSKAETIEKLIENQKING